MVAVMSLEMPARLQETVARHDLLLAVRAGDARAREEFAAEAGRAAFAFALQLLRNPEDARDVSQESVVRLLGSLDRVDVQRGSRSWLFRIVRNLVIDLQRRNRVRKTQPLETLLGDSATEMTDPQADPHRDLQRRRLQERMWRALQTLSNPHREILVLREYQDLSYAEIASVLEIAEGTVMSRLHGARKNLRSVLLDGNDSLEGGYR